MAATSLLPFASKKNLSGMFGAEARAQTMQTVRQGGSRLLSGAKDFGAQAWGGMKNLAASEGMSGVKALGSQAWSGAKNLGSQAVNGVKNLGAQAISGAKNLGTQAWSGAKNLGDRAIIGAKNVGIRAANERDNLIYQAKVLEAKLSPAMATPEGIPLRPMPEPPTQRPLIPVPDKQKPLMMNTNNPDGPQGAGLQSEPKVPKGDRPAVPTAKENPKGVAIPGRAEAKANAIAARKAARQPGYKPTEEDAFHIVADAFNRGKLSKQQVISATFDPKTGKWTLGENTGVPENLSPQLRGWKQRTQQQAETGKIPTERWEVGNCAEPNSINNASYGKPSSLDTKHVYTFEARNVKVTQGAPREPRLFYKEPCAYCQTLHGEGVKMPQYDRWLNNNNE
jgi:hypothetical protein